MTFLKSILRKEQERVNLQLKKGVPLKIIYRWLNPNVPRRGIASETCGSVS